MADGSISPEGSMVCTHLLLLSWVPLLSDHTLAYFRVVLTTDGMGKQTSIARLLTISGSEMLASQVCDKNTLVTHVDSIVHELEFRPELSLLCTPIGGSEST